MSASFLLGHLVVFCRKRASILSDQKLGDVVDDPGWPNHFGPEGDQVESSLGRGPPEVLGIKIDTCHPIRSAESRSAWATGGIGHWEGSDHTRFLYRLGIDRLSNISL